MSLFSKFSVSYNMEQASRKKVNNTIQETTMKFSINHGDKSQMREFLGEDLLKPLIGFGYELDQIMLAFKIYKFGTVDEALSILMRDTETNKYNHRFISLNSNEGGYDDVRALNCFLCGELRAEHIDLDIDMTHLPRAHLESEINQKIPKEDNFNDTSIEHERSSLPMIKTSDQSGLIEKKLNSDRKKIQSYKVDISKETLELFEDPEVCRICFSEILNTSNKAQFACGHKFCKTCVTNHLSVNITNGKVLMIKCLYGGCPKTFTDEEVKEYVSNEIFNKYRKFKITQMKMNHPDKLYINCPSPDCEEIIDFESVQESESMMECNLGHRFCAKCKMLGWHENGKCKNYDDFLLNQIKKNSDSINYKQCPQCSVIIEKNEGCNQMKCLNCNFEFCWLCLKKYTVDHYAIYNFTGCPGMRFNTPERKRWWNNPILKTIWLILSFFLGFFAVCLLIVFFAFFGCCYEFIKCYLNKKPDHDENDIEFQREEFHNQIAEVNNPQEQHEPNEVVEVDKCKKNSILALLIFLGILCQPLYLLFYLLYAMMECYRRFSCWFYYVDY